MCQSLGWEGGLQWFRLSLFSSPFFFFCKKNESSSPLPPQNLIQRNCSAVTARVLPWLLGSTCGYGNRKLPVVSATSTLEGMEWPLIGAEAVRFLKGGGQIITFSGQMGISYPFLQEQEGRCSFFPALSCLPPTSIPHIPRTQLLAVYQDLLHPHYLM